MKSQIDHLMILTHPDTIKHLEEWDKLLEPIGRKALELAKETGVKVPEEYAWYYKLDWLKSSITGLAQLLSHHKDHFSS